MKGSLVGGGGGGGGVLLVLPKQFFKKKLKEIKDQNKKLHKKLEGGFLWF